jgi:hypothetical protein
LKFRSLERESIKDCFCALLLVLHGLRQIQCTNRERQQCLHSHFPWFVWCREYCLKSSVFVNFSTSSTSKNFAWLNLVCDSWTVLLRMRPPPRIFFLGVYCSFGDCACADPSMSNSQTSAISNAVKVTIRPDWICM